MRHCLTRRKQDRYGSRDTSLPLLHFKGIYSLSYRVCHSLLLLLCAARYCLSRAVITGSCIPTSKNEWLKTEMSELSRGKQNDKTNKTDIRYTLTNNMSLRGTKVTTKYSHSHTTILSFNINLIPSTTSGSQAIFV